VVEVGVRIKAGRCVLASDAHESAKDADLLAQVMQVCCLAGFK